MNYPYIEGDNHMGGYRDRLEKSVNYVQGKIGSKLKIGLILGSGLGKVAEEINKKITIKYRDIPGFPISTVQGHKGELICGKFGGKNILLFNGRYHYYQGFSLQEVTLPVRVARRIGIETLIITNASGGISRDFKPGDIMLINDHINYMGANPLIGEDTASFGPLFVDMTEPYDRELIKRAKETAYRTTEIGELKEGVYLATSGPSYETRAEISFFKKIGADAVGMSTVPEVIVASQEGMKVLGVSIIANMACGMSRGKLSHNEVLKNINNVSSRVIIFLREIIRNL
ncbi:Purine nucleoside phosphorylase 1 [subsurface metagenome]